MNQKNLINSKKNGKDISELDIESLINAFVNNEINDKSMTVFLKAVQTHGMTKKETNNETTITKRTVVFFLFQKCPILVGK